MQFFQAHILKCKFFKQPDSYLWRSGWLIWGSFLLSSLPSWCVLLASIIHNFFYFFFLILCTYLNENLNYFLISSLFIWHCCNSASLWSLSTVTYFVLTKGMVNLVVAVVLLFVDHGAENWYDVNKHTYNYLPDKLTCNGPTLRDQFKTHWKQFQKS